MELRYVKASLPIRPTEENHFLQGERVWCVVEKDDDDQLQVRVDNHPVADMYRTISAIAHTCALANDPECYNSRHYMSYREMHELVLEDLKKYKTLLGEEE